MCFAFVIGPVFLAPQLAPIRWLNCFMVDVGGKICVVLGLLRKRNLHSHCWRCQAVEVLVCASSKTCAVREEMLAKNL